MVDSELTNALGELDEDEVNELVKTRIEAGTDPLAIVNELRAGMDVVGDRYKAGEYFLSELIASAEIFQQAMKRIEPLLEAAKSKDKAVKIVLGTAQGDIHNIGKDIVGTLLKAAGFEVFDLGIDVAPAAFVDKVNETGATIVGISGLLTPSFNSMKKTIEVIEAAGLRDKVKIVIGGGVVTEKVRAYTGADAFTIDAIEGVQLCKQYAKEDRQ